MWWLVKKLFKKRVKSVYYEGYDKGLANGYEFGYIMGRSDMRSYMHCLTRVEKEIDDILTEKDF